MESPKEEGYRTETGKLELLRQVAAGIAAQFGSSCEVVVHDLSKHPDHSIVAIENGGVTGRKVGDGASHVVIEQLQNQDTQPKDHLCYLTKTPDGKILKSSSMYIRNAKGKVAAIFSINYDISRLLMVESAVSELISTGAAQQTEPEKIVNINDLLDDLIEQSVALVGKPVALMNKDDKVRAIRFLNQNGAFLVTKSGDKVAKYFGISKYTLYSYIDNKQENKLREDKAT
jgi:predicted transcriptional regulator YheO